MKNKKVAAETTTSQLQIDNDLTITEFTTNSAKFQYNCSFCHRQLGNNSVIFSGISACKKCYTLSHLLVNNLRRHWRQYSKRFEVKR